MQKNEELFIERIKELRTLFLVRKKLYIILNKEEFYE